MGGIVLDTVRWCQFHLRRIGHSDTVAAMELDSKTVSGTSGSKPIKTSEFDFELPSELIAQEPLEDREAARMMVVDRATGNLSHHTVRDLPEFLRAGDCLVMNDTRVIPARIHGNKEKTGGHVELLLLEELPDGQWEALCGSARRPKPGVWLAMAGGAIQAEVTAWREGGGVIVRMHSDRPLMDVLEEVGLPPLPPYIKRPQTPPQEVTERDRLYYQTVYARVPGAVAAPTAGLHLTESLLATLGSRGISRATVTLHVGMGTFKPVKVDTVADHIMEAERYEVPEATVAAIGQCRQRGGRVVAVGSTTVRTLETAAVTTGVLQGGSGRTRIFIYPPYSFKVVDAMLTNFHLPRSTLLMMVSALAGSDLIRNAYTVAIQERYRFYSYGDCMLII